VQQIKGKFQTVLLKPKPGPDLPLNPFPEGEERPDSIYLISTLVLAYMA